MGGVIGIARTRRVRGRDLPRTYARIRENARPRSLYSHLDAKSYRQRQKPLREEILEKVEGKAKLQTAEPLIPRIATS